MSCLAEYSGLNGLNPQGFGVKLALKVEPLTGEPSTAWHLEAEWCFPVHKIAKF